LSAAAAERTEAHSLARWGAINKLVIALPEPAPIAAAGEHARRRFIDFFTAHVIILRRERVDAGCIFAPGADWGVQIGG
jgi:hypothetical protein